MGKTHAKKEESREARLKTLPRSERLAKQATIKKKEGRVLDASEKHALKMTTEYGEIMRLWETLRTSIDPTADPLVVAERLKKKNDRREQRRQAKSSGTKRIAFAQADEDDEDDDDDEQDAAPGAAAATKATSEGAVPVRAVERFEYKYATIDQLMRIIAPQFATAAKTPRVSRVLQSMIKYGSNAHLDKMIGLMHSDFALFCNDAFAHFIVCALIRHAPHQQYKKILGMLIPIIPTIVSHKFGMQVVHAAFSSKLCSALDRNLLLLGVFKDSVSIMKHWKGYPVLEDILEQELDHRKRLLQRLFDLTDKLISTKDAFVLPFVQRLVYAFLQHGTKHEITEMCVTLKPHLGALCESKEGSVLASLAFSLLEPRARKDSLRAFAERLGDLLVGKYSAPVIARLFDLVYDAQLLHKYVAAGLAEHMAAVVNSPYGFLILVHLVTPDDARRERVLLPGWKEHNLYSAGNNSWNTHEWLDVEYKKETVEICSKPASRTHLSVLPPLVRKFLDLIGDAAMAAKLNKTHVGLIARELLHVNENEPSFTSALKLSAQDVALLKGVLPNKDQKRIRENEGDAPVSAAKGATSPSLKSATPQQEKPLKKARTEPTATPQRKSATVAAPESAAKGSTTKKPAGSNKRLSQGSSTSDGSFAFSPVAIGKQRVSDVLPTTDDDAPVERSARVPIAPMDAATPSRPSAGKSAKKATPMSSSKKR